LYYGRSNKLQWFDRYRTHLIDKSLTIGADFCDRLYKIFCKSCYRVIRGPGWAGVFAPVVKTRQKKDLFAIRANLQQWRGAKPQVSDVIETAGLPNEGTVQVNAS